MTVTISFLNKLLSRQFTVGTFRKLMLQKKNTQFSMCHFTFLLIYFKVCSLIKKSYYVNVAIYKVSHCLQVCLLYSGIRKYNYEG